MTRHGEMLKFSRRYNPQRVTKRVFIYLALIIIAIGFILPYIWLVSSSFKTVDSFSTHDFQLIPLNAEGQIYFNFENYVNAWNELQIPTVMLNTFLVCVVNTACNLFLNSLAAFAFARIRFCGRDKIFLICIMSMMVPGCVMLIPNFIIIDAIGLLDSLPALILPFVMSIYNIFLLRQQFLAIDNDIEDAARIEGASFFQIYWRVCMPIVKPMLIVLSITTFMWNYNNYLWPLLVINSPESYTLAISLGNLMRIGAVDVSMYPVMLAGAVITSTPMIIIFCVLQKYIIGGTFEGAIK